MNLNEIVDDHGNESLDSKLDENNKYSAPTLEGGHSISSPTTDDPLGLLHFTVDIKSVLHPSGRKPKKKVLEFYKKQNSLIETFLQPVGQQSEEEILDKGKLKIVLYGSLAANVFLFAMQLTAAILSHSLALFATTSDAFMDLCSSIVLVVTAHYSKSRDFIKYPSGRRRIETVGIIVFSTLMATLSIQLIIESITALVSKDHVTVLDYVAIGAVALALVIKLVLYIYCRALTRYPTAKIFAQDHRNDVIFNSIGLIFSVMGAKLLWWLDPAGGLLIALLILRSWSSTTVKHIKLIIGKVADPATLQHLTYVALTHDDRIKFIDTCRAFHAGDSHVVEVDIVLPPDMTVRDSHDIAETLQVKFEKLSFVERAYVHIDYEATHAPEHQWP